MDKGTTAGIICLDLNTKLYMAPHGDEMGLLDYWQKVLGEGPSEAAQGN